MLAVDGFFSASPLQSLTLSLFCSSTLDDVVSLVMFQIKIAFIHYFNRFAASMAKTERVCVRLFVCVYLLFVWAIPGTKTLSTLCNCYRLRLASSLPHKQTNKHTSIDDAHRTSDSGHISCKSHIAHRTYIKYQL